jgi:hypothetical protein
MPPQHAQAPMHLPPDALDVHSEATQAVPADWGVQGYPPDPPNEASVRDAAAMVPAEAADFASQAYPAPDYAAAVGAPVADDPRLAGAPVATTLGGHSSASAPLRPVALAGAPHAFNEQPRSESGAAHPLPPGAPIVKTRQGYANAPTMTRSDPYPRAEAQEIDLNVSLQPSNRLLYIGLGVVLIGIIVLLAISIADGPEQSAPPIKPSSSQATPGESSAHAAAIEPGAGTLKPEVVKPEAFREPSPAGSDATATGRRELIHLYVVSTPPGADVSLGGKLLGATPLDTAIERRTGTDTLTIHRPRYKDVTATVDLSADFTRTVALIPIPEAAPKPSDRGDRPERPTARPPVRDNKRPLGKDEDCQPPDKINPYELACHGHVCKPCPPSKP